MFPGISTELHIFLLWKQDGRGYIILTNLGKEDTRLIRKERVSKRGILDLIMHMSKMLVPIAVLVVKEWGTKPKNSIGTKNLSWVKKLATQNKPKDRRVSEFWRWPLTFCSYKKLAISKHKTVKLHECLIEKLNFI